MNENHVPTRTDRVVILAIFGALMATPAVATVLNAIGGGGTP